ncbi:protein YIPF2 isoform X1 [Ascaphus truei]|uniref:protein YIPF2 isoform X1 n=1 Tax=Ascaphus truei TaxID=8439 RepID=UPI003F59F05D
MATTDDLKFQEFDEAADLLASSPDATTRSVTEGARQDHATLRMGADSEGEDDTDQTELLSGQKKSASFWTFQYYQDFFEIDTYQVLDRIRASLLPIPGKNFVRHHLRNNPDLYGPFWICATLVFTVTIMGNLATFLQKQGSSDYHYSPQFHKVSVAGIAIYSYALMVPLGLWGFLQWRKGVSPSVGSYSFIETACVYGYSLSVYIPTTVLWLIPIDWFRWLLILVAMCLSGSVLILTFWPHIRGDNKMVAVATVTSMVVLHALLAVGCKMYFFEEPQAHTSVPTAAATTTAQKITHTTKH